MATKEELMQQARHEPHFKTYENLGKILMDEGNLNEAILYLSAAAGLGTKQSRPRFLLAQCLMAIGDLDHAAIKLREALDLNPSYKSAAKLLNELLAKDPTIIERLEIQPLQER